MPQEEADIREANKKKGALKDGKVLPKEDVEIYSTGAGKHLGPEGTKHTVHRVMVDKIVGSGQATLNAPEEGAVKKKGVKLTKNELIALERRLGHAPTAEEIAQAVQEKEDEL